RDDVDALRAAGYAWYGGNDIFPCDWEKSRDCFLRLMELDTVSDLDKCQYANTLGYIYYYGRCNGGEPEYGEALRYFTLGAAGGLYESIYKLSDMYVHGYGVPKNTRAASTLVDMVYGENLKRICRGEYGCQFADSALRMGNLVRDKIMFGDEYYYYTLADFAIRKRLPFKYYGDSNVFAGIQKELARIRETKPVINKTSLALSGPPYVFRELFKDYSCMVTVKPLKKGVKITASRMPKPDENTVECVFSCFPEYGACDLVSEMSFTITGEGTFIPAAKFDFIADSFELYDTREDGSLLVFSHHGVELYSVTVEKFTFRLPARPKKDATEYNFVSVVFGKGGRQYDYICEVPDVSVGDRVIVFASGEEKSVEVVRVFKMAVGDMPLGPGGYKKILRKA
ncbi:MAG: sel1 repeat family protein, partial [Oscillospiraceae bacterium]|nr:sel1 repeat family protein [Oscillospiraceae bacterium]